MVVVQLVGGLGNKLFQYAAARRLAFMQNTELKLDEITSLYGKVNGGYTNLEPFNIKAEFATPLEIIYAQRLSQSQNISQSIILRKKL